MTEKRSIVLYPQRMKLAEYERQEWVVNAELGTTIEDVLETGYWSHMASQMKPYDHVEVRIDDGTWVANLLVLMTGRNWAKVHLIQEIKLTSADVAMTQAEKYDIAWKGPQHKWSVIRIADKEMVNKGFDNKEQAAVWLANHEKIA